MTRGTGRAAYADGSSYDGEWIEGEKHGRGKLVLADGTTCEGTFLDGTLQGVGKLVYTDGGIFEGEIFMYMPNGHGVYTQGVDGESLGSQHAGSAGDVYDGNWSEGQRHGNCKYTFCNGMICHWLHGYCAEFTLCQATVLAATGSAVPRAVLEWDVEPWPFDSEGCPLSVVTARDRIAAACDFIARWDSAALLRVRRRCCSGSWSQLPCPDCFI
jgi:hypothetical protein